MIAWTLFHHPVRIPWHWQLWLLLPLCAVVAVVYKTVRTYHIRHLPRDTAAVFLYMLGGLAVLGVILWLLVSYWP